MDEFLEILEIVEDDLTSGGPATDAGASVAAAEPAPERDPLDAVAGDVLAARWEVLRRLGTGSTSRAFLARDVTVAAAEAPADGPGSGTGASSPSNTSATSARRALTRPRPGRASAAQRLALQLEGNRRCRLLAAGLDRHLDWGSANSELEQLVRIQRLRRVGYPSKLKIQTRCIDSRYADGALDAGAWGRS